MIKYVFVFDVGNPEQFDRWYFRYHSKECVRFFGPWLRRYETYRAFDAPPEADGFGVRRGRMTELWFSSVEDFVEARPNERPYTPLRISDSGPTKPSAVTMVPAMPTEDFLGREPRPEECDIVRWIMVFKYPDGVPVREGEDWYLATHTQEAKEVPGLLKYVSHRVLEDPPIQTAYHRVTELWFESLDAWKDAIGSERFAAMTPPPWGDKYGSFDLVSTFVPYKPDVDFLKDEPRIP